MTIFDAASARESLWFIFVGAAVVLPMIIGYTIFSYKVFWGKTTKLKLLIRYIVALYRHIW